MPEPKIIARLLKGGAWALAGKALTTASGIAANALLARLLAPEELGAYFLMLSLVSAASVLAQLGLGQTAVRFVATALAVNDGSRAKRSIVLIIAFALAGCALLSSILILGVGRFVVEQLFELPTMPGMIELMVVWMVFLVFEPLIAEMFLGFHDIRLAVVFGSVVSAVGRMLLFAGLWTLRGTGDILEVVMLSIIAGASSVVLSSLFLGKKVKALPKESSKDQIAGEILRVSLPLWITAVVLFLLVQADLWVMGLFRPPDEVAIYGAVTRLVALITIPLLIINSVLPPTIAELYAKGRTAELESVLKKSAAVSGLPSIFALLIFGIFGGQLLGLIYGDYYRAGVSILLVLSIGQVVNVWAGSCGKVLMLTGHQKAMMAITLVSGLISIVLALVLVDAWGGVGVATAASAGMIVQNMLMLAIVKLRIGIWTFADPFALRDLRGFK